MQKQIEAAVGPKVNVLSSAEETAKDVEAILRYNNQLRTDSEPPQHVFHASGSVPIFRSIAERWLDQGTLDIDELNFKIGSNRRIVYLSLSFCELRCTTFLRRIIMLR